MHHQDRSFSHQSKDFIKPAAEFFMDCQTSRGSGAEAEAGTTSVHSEQGLLRSPNPSIRSRQRLPSGLLKDFRVGGEDTRNQAHLSDDGSGSDDSPDGCNLSGKHERTNAVLASALALKDTACKISFGSHDQREPSPLVTLTDPKKDLSLSSSSSIRKKNFPGDSQEAAQHRPSTEDGDRGFSYLMPETAFGKEVEETPGL